MIQSYKRSIKLFSGAWEFLRWLIQPKSLSGIFQSPESQYNNSCQFRIWLGQARIRVTYLYFNIRTRIRFFLHFFYNFTTTLLLHVEYMIKMSIVLFSKKNKETNTVEKPDHIWETKRELVFIIKNERYSWKWYGFNNT